MPDGDMRETLDRFLVVTYERAKLGAYEAPVSVAQVAADMGVPLALATKIARFFEHEGLVDYDDQAVDITVEGILRAETILREQRQGARKKE